MAIRLTESKLRQIIREEAAKLTRRPGRRLSEMARGSSVAKQADVMAANYGATHYMDYDLDVYPEDLGGAGPGENVAEYLVDMIPELQGAISGSEDMVVMIDPHGPGGGMPVFRFYGDESTMDMLADAFGEMENGPPRTDIIKPLKVSKRMMDT